MSTSMASGSTGEGVLRSAEAEEPEQTLCSNANRQRLGELVIPLTHDGQQVM